MYILAVVVGLAAGAGFMWLYVQAKNKALSAEVARLSPLEAALSQKQQENTALAVLNTRLEQEKLSLEKERALVEKNFKEIADTYKAQFSDLANKILEEKAKGMEIKNSETLKPLTLHLENFVKKVSDMERITTEKQGALEKGLAEVIRSTEKVDKSAVNLTNAIKGQSIVRGTWGEEALRRILDAAGMKAGLDYFEQVSEEGKRVDMQIALPGERWIVVDSKTIFNHFEEYCNCEDPKQKDAFMDAHVKDIKRTIEDLSSKKYYKKFAETGEKVQPDYTLMFVYPEAALMAAAEHSPEVLTEAWKNNIALVSATSLMSTLKMVSKLWDIDRQHQYMDDLKEDVFKLMEKFNDFLVNFAKTENAVSNAFDAVKIARGHIDGNRGAILPVAQRIADMYEVPVNRANMRVIKRMGYEYTGGKAKNKELPKKAKPVEQPVEEPPNLFDE